MSASSFTVLEKYQALLSPPQNEGGEQKVIAAARSIRALNPNASILFYFAVDYARTWYTLGSWFDNHPELEVHNADGSLAVVESNDHGDNFWHVFDFAQEDARSAWVNDVALVLATPDDNGVPLFSGVFIDGYRTNSSWASQLIPKASPAEQQAWLAGVAQVGPALSDALGANSTIRIINPGQTSPQWPGYNAISIEFFDASDTSITYLQSLAAAGSFVEVHSYAGADAGKFNQSLAAYLVAAGERAYFGAGSEWSQCDDWLLPHPEYAQPLGAPDGVANQSTPGIYTRTFGGGKVRVRVDANTQDVCVWWSDGSTTGNACSAELRPPFSTQAAAAAGCRDRRLQPFSSTSVWNMPVGSGAVYSPAHIYDPSFFNATWRCTLRVNAPERRSWCTAVPQNATEAQCVAAGCCYDASVAAGEGGGAAGRPTCFFAAGSPPSSGFHPDQDLVVYASPSDPETPFLDRAWVGPPNCCTVSGPQRGTIQFPENFTTDCILNNNAAAVISADQTRVLNFQPLYRGSPGSPIMAQWPPTSPYPFDAGWNVSIEGDGTWGAHGGSFLSSIGGTIRAGELLPGAPPIPHALKLELFAHDYYWPGFSGPECFVWPALACDGYARGDSFMGYMGIIDTLKPGSLLAVPPAVAPSVAVTTVPGAKILAALTTYGGYLVDDTAGDGAAICMEPPAMHDLSVYGLNFNISTPVTPQSTGVALAFFEDLLSIFRALQIVVNNGPNQIGGGGQPLAPLAPPLCPPAV